MYRIIDLHTKLYANNTLYKSRKTARRGAERLNMIYGAHRYVSVTLDQVLRMV